jgi:hypothetical protein
MSPPREGRPGGNTNAETAHEPASRATATIPPRGTQIPPVGPHPDVDVLFVGSLLWSTPAYAAEVLAFVLDDDIESPTLAIVLGAVRTLAYAGKPVGPQLVLDELRRFSAIRGDVAEQLKTATTSGADPGAARFYAAAVVADSLRRRVASAGVALTDTARGSAEADLAPLVTRAATACTDCAERLRHLRGDPA